MDPSQQRPLVAVVAIIQNGGQNG